MNWPPWSVSGPSSPRMPNPPPSTAAGGPAKKTGLKAEDMIISVGGQQVQGLADFYRKICGLGEPGVPVPMKVLKGDQLQEIEVNSADRYKEQSQRNAGGIRI